MVPSAGRRRGSVFLRGIGPTRTEPTTTRSPIFSPRAANCSATVRFSAFALTCSTNHRVFSNPSTACVNATCIALPGFSSRPLSAVTKRGLSGIAALTVHHRPLRRSSTINRPASSLIGERQLHRLGHRPARSFPISFHVHLEPARLSKPHGSPPPSHTLAAPTVDRGETC